MAEAQTASLAKGNIALYGAYLGIGLALLALILLAAAPLGWRAGWWHYRFAFAWLMPLFGLYCGRRHCHLPDHRGAGSVPA